MTFGCMRCAGRKAQCCPSLCATMRPRLTGLFCWTAAWMKQAAAIAYEYPNAEVQPSPFSPTNYDDKIFTEYSQLKYREARGKADWVIWVDVDEFLYSGKPLRETLDEYRAMGIRAVKCEGVQMVAPEFPESGGLLTDLVRVGAYDTIYNKTAVFDPMLNVRWSVGRHSCAIDGLEPTWTGLKLLHYRYFGDEWLRARNATQLGAAQRTGCTGGARLPGCAGLFGRQVQPGVVQGHIEARTRSDMTFSPPFRKPFSNPFPTAAAGAWWNLFGAIPLANCVAAIRSRRAAANLAASYINLLVTPNV